MTISDSSTHAITRFAHAVDAALDRVLESTTLFMTPAEKEDALVTLAKVETRMAALKYRILANADDACEDGAHRTVADLVSAKTHEDRGRAVADQHLAVALERFGVVAAALATGQVSVSKARVILAELTTLDLDPDVPHDVVDRAEQHLVSQAPDFTTREIRRLAKKVLESVAPWIEEDRERKRLEAEERRAQQRLSLKFFNAPDGLEGVAEIRAAPVSPQPKHGAWPATPPSSPSSSAETPKSSTSAAHHAYSPPPNAKPWL